MKEKKHGIRTFDLVMSFAVTTFGALFFLCITRSLNGESIFNPWISAFFCATLFLTFLSLFAITIAKKKMIIPIVTIAFLPSIIFMPVVIHMCIVCVAAIIAIKGLYVMRKSLFNVLKINIGTIMRSGIAYLTFAFLLVLSSQYYFFVKENVEIKFDASEHVKLSNMAVDYILQKSGVNDIAIGTMSVDDFLMFMIENVNKDVKQGPQLKTDEGEMLVRLAGSVGVEVEKVQENVQESMLVSMRENMSELVGREMRGDEMITDVMSEILSIQIDKLVSENLFLKKNKAEIFTFVFFVIIFSLIPFVRFASVLLARFLFMVLKEFKIINVITTQRDAEVISM